MGKRRLPGVLVAATQEGTIVGATFIEAPSSTRKRTGMQGPEIIRLGRATSGFLVRRKSRWTPARALSTA